MSVTPARNPFEDGPFVRMATVCERVIEEKDNVWTIVRIIDRLTRHAVGAAAPGEMEPFEVAATLAIHLDGGGARGSHEMSIRLEAPSGLSQPLLTMTVTFESEDRGVRFILPGRFTVNSAGLYWFHVLFNGQLLTKVPLRILYERLSTGA